MSVGTIGFVNEHLGIPLPDGRTLPFPMLLEEDRNHRAAYHQRALEACAKTRGIDLAAAADFMGPGAIEVPRFESEILDMVRRRGLLGQRIRTVPATGQPSRYFEQKTIAAGAFTDPRIISQTAETPQRVERPVTLKAISGQVNFGLFDVEVTRQQGQFSQLVAKDITDLIQGMLRTSDKAIWRGTDTSLSISTTSEYVGGLTQINRTFAVASTASIVDAVKAEVASMMSNESFAVRPTAVYCHPQTLDLIEQEERLNHRQMSQVPVTTRDNTVVAGLTVSALSTAAGLLPLLPDWTLTAPAASQTEQGKYDYTLAIVTEELIEYHYLTAVEPRVFVLGLLGNLATQYVAVMFGAPVFKGNADATNTPETSVVTYAHSVGTITR